MLMSVYISQVIDMHQTLYHPGQTVKPLYCKRLGKYIPNLKGSDRYAKSGKKQAARPIELKIKISLLVLATY